MTELPVTDGAPARPPNPPTWSITTHAATPLLVVHVGGDHDPDQVLTCLKWASILAVARLAQRRAPARWTPWAVPLGPVERDLRTTADVLASALAAERHPTRRSQTTRAAFRLMIKRGELDALRAAGDGQLYAAQIGRTSQRDAAVVVAGAQCIMGARVAAGQADDHGSLIVNIVDTAEIDARLEPRAWTAAIWGLSRTATGHDVAGRIVESIAAAATHLEPRLRPLIGAGEQHLVRIDLPPENRHCTLRASVLEFPDQPTHERIDTNALLEDAAALAEKTRAGANPSAAPGPRILH